MLLPAATERPFFTQGFPLTLPLEHEVRIASFHGSATGTFPHSTTPQRILSDTNQLSWYTSANHGGLITIDTPRTQALIGFLRHREQKVTNVAVEVNNTFCTLQVTSLDQQPIVSSAKLLLIAGGAVENTGQVWNSAGTDLTSFGHAPTVIDQVRGTLTLRHLQAARAVSLQPLDGAGQPLGAPVQARSQGNDWALPLGSTTTWYLVTIIR